MVLTKKVGVALSGGGYRASAFHIGTLRALYKLNLLPKIDILSTISGGSITGAHYCLFKGDFKAFEEDLSAKVEKANLIRYILTSNSALQLLLFTLIFFGSGVYFLFTSYAWLFLPLFTLWGFLLMKYQFYIFPAGKELEAAYEKFYFKGATLKELCTQPVLAISSSNLQTGRPFTFSFRKMGDSTYNNLNPPIKFLQKNFPVSRAVTASSCVPFAFTPVSIKKEFYEEPADFDRIDPKLIDGGVYDNQGIHKLTQPRSSYECNIILVSDAGGKLSFSSQFGNTVTLLVRTVDLFMNRIKAFQMVENLYQNAKGANKEIAYLSLGWDLERCIPGFVDNMVRKTITDKVLTAHVFEPAWIEEPQKYRNAIERHLKDRVDYHLIEARNLSKEDLSVARNTGTNLTPLSRRQITLLAQHAENLTELQIKLYCPTLINDYAGNQ